MLLPKYLPEEGIQPRVCLVRLRNVIDDAGGILPDRDTAWILDLMRKNLWNELGGVSA